MIPLSLRRLFTLLLNALRLDAEAGEVDHASLLDVVLQLCLLFETFVLATCPHFPPETGFAKLCDSTWSG